MLDKRSGGYFTFDCFDFQTIIMTKCFRLDEKPWALAPRENRAEQHSCGRRANLSLAVPDGWLS
jgi:hypothetical protein